jgi:hypothetical protein
LIFYSITNNTPKTSKMDKEATEADELTLVPSVVEEGEEEVVEGEEVVAVAVVVGWWVGGGAVGKGLGLQM